METRTVIDGRLNSLVDVRDRGFNYGHGVFETMRLVDGELVLWEYHRTRLLRGLTILHIPAGESQVASSIERLLSDSPAEGIVKLIVTAGVSGRGYATRQKLAPSVVVQWSPLPERTNHLVSLQECQYRLPINPVLAGIKHLNRLDQVLAATELSAGSQGLLLDMEGRVVEALSHNVFAYHDGQWLTPSLTRCGVEGVMRTLLLDRVFPAMDVKPQVADFGVELLCNAEAVFICNSIVGVQCVSEVRGRKVYSDQSQTERVKARLGAMYPCFNV